MATANADGSIILTTKVEDSGLKSGMEKIISEQKTKLQSLTREYAKLITNNQQNTEEAKKLKKEIDNLSKSIKQNETILKSFGESSSEALEQTTEAVENSSKSFSKFQSALKSIAGYLALAFSVTKIIQFSNESASLATQTEASVQRLVDIYGEASGVVGDFIDQNARALGMSKSAAAAFSSVYGNLFSVFSDQVTNAKLTNEYLRMTAVVASKTGRTIEDVQERVRSGLLGNTEAIEDLGIFVNVKTIEMTDAFQRMANGKSWEQLDVYTQQQIRAFAILEQSASKYGKEVANTSAIMRSNFNAAYQDFQNSWGTVVNHILMPILQMLTEIFTIMTAGFNALAGISGKTLEETEKLEDSTSTVLENTEEQTDAQKGLNKELKKSLARFDDIEILSNSILENSLEQSSQGGNQLGTENGTLGSEQINAALLAIMGVVDTALIAIGLILFMTGNIGWGLGFIIAGGILLTITAASVGQTDIDEQAKSRINAIMAVAGGAFIAIGLLLLFLGQIPWGLGFIAGGGGLIGLSTVFATTSSDDVMATCDAILAFLAGLVAYLITNALLTHWGTFVTLWGNFYAFLQLVVEHGFFKTIIELFGTSLSKIQLWAIAIGVIVGAIAYLAANWDKLSPAQRTITILSALAAAATAAAVAIALFHTSWSVGVAAAAIAGGVALLAGTYLFKSYNGKKDLSGSGEAPESIDQYASMVPSGNYKLPALAKGTVVPPNREFLAVLGDNSKEHEIVSPLSTMKQAFSEAIIEMGGNVGFGKTEVVLEIDGREFGRAVVEQGDRESRRIGTKMVVV